MSPSPSGKLDTDRAEMEHIQPAMSIPISPELFEQLYLQPQNRVKGDLRKTFANPTPVALAGFLLCATPVSMSLLGWQGAGGFAAAANVGAYFGIGALLLIMGGLGEWILGNTFPCTIFFTFGGFWIAFGATIVPGSGAYSTYSTTGNAADGLKEPSFYSTFALFLVAMAILCAVYSIASIRTNVCLFTVLVLLIPCFSCLAASFFAVAQGNASRALQYQHVGAGILFAVIVIGWYMLTSMLLLSVDFPVVLPLGDLSTIIRGRTEAKPISKGV
ncbi:hypothetical protein FPOAC2_05430 [Fusarium poae]|jgi:succinate-acetate transporter protein|uniref:hypothetical protein n=1 Tax=Fusarium poae TaxID=36050 RepID=UPI001CE7DBE4|nr:hypothetical protein FPOAC1_005319 [Fusarium poae]KAG8672059.1 hypothetical protein FPOAC1_005319 [Fusarium poae]